MDNPLPHWQSTGLLSALATKGRYTNVSRIGARHAYAQGKSVFIRVGTKAPWRVLKATLISDAPNNITFCVEQQAQ